MIRRFLLATTASVALSTSATFAGGVAEPAVAPAAVVQTTTSSSAGGYIVPLILLLVLAAAVAGHPQGMVYPMFMAGGWFPMTELPRRMAAAGGMDWAYLPPFGLDERVQALVVTLAQEAAAAQGRTPAQTDVLLAAHGSFRSAAPSEVAQAVAKRLKAAGFARAEAFFIDQEPRIATATGFGAGSVCLPFFAAEGGHVTDDLPDALAEAGFRGLLLPPLGLDARVPSLIAAALQGQSQTL